VKKNPVVVFLGPSLPLDEAKALLAADYRPPARQGDVFRAIDARVKVLVLIDGVFESVPSVWHHELRAAMASGLIVFGAASMGALRAAELRDYGMRGVGRIYRRYVSGDLVDDDAVALLHGPQEYQFRGLTVPWVNVEATLHLAHSKGQLTAAAARKMRVAAQALHYQERTWSRIERAAPKSFSTWRQRHAVDVKAQDARACLRAAARAQRQIRSPRVSPVSLSAQVRHQRWQATHGPWLQSVRDTAKAVQLRADGMRVLALAHWAKTLALPTERQDVLEAWSQLSTANIAPDLLAQFAEALALEKALRRHLNAVVSDAPIPDEALVLGALLQGVFP
jgi:hypothetical protein